MLESQASFILVDRNIRNDEFLGISSNVLRYSLGSMAYGICVGYVTWNPEKVNGGESTQPVSNF